MPKLWKRDVLLLASFTVGALWLARAAQATPMAHLVLESEPGDYIGQGSDFDITYTPDTSALFFPQIRRTIGPLLEPAELLFVLGTVTGGSDNTFALLFFGTDALVSPSSRGSIPMPSARILRCPDTPVST